MNKYLKRLKNPTTLIGITGYILTIISTLGIKVNNDTIMTIINSICAICVLLGILSNPDNKAK